MTVTRISPCICSSMTAPQTTYAAAWALSAMLEAASGTSICVMSGPPVMLIKRPRASSIDESSSTGST
jgi:hypothetical protein